MALLVTYDCINCDACAPVCPNDAIIEGEEVYKIIPTLCTECVGVHDKPACQSVCPIAGCIVPDPQNILNLQTCGQRTKAKSAFPPQKEA